MLVYDGDCDFCTASARRVGTPAVPYQELGVDGLARFGLTLDDARRAAWWVDEGGRTFRGHLAIPHALASTHGPRAVAGRILLVPPFRWIAAGVYPLVVRWRRFIPH